MSYTKKFSLNLKPIANPDAVIKADRVRFAVLTSNLIRMEYSPDNRFEDRASQVFWYREQPVPRYNVIMNENGLEIITDDLHLHYIYSNNGFARENLFIEVKKTGTVWHYGDTDPENLLGTARTLDRADGMIELDMGLISRAGWSLVDDTKSLVFSEEYMLVSRETIDNSMYRDLYFFGYGHDYKKCMRDYFQVAGNVPLIPRWALGNWWSRYWEYSQAELKELMLEFREKKSSPVGMCYRYGLAYCEGSSIQRMDGLYMEQGAVSGPGTTNRMAT
ncbi:MAG: hypothetical protein GX213_07185 [Clostridiaceae bacterium]|nr:hypothetical protein [Clostridiaceae bacterium]NLX71569.1 hypothetical protein [Clostridiales bacterium]